MAGLNHINYTENLFQAIDTIVAERIHQQTKDVTVIATIVDARQRARGIYKVTEDNRFIYMATSQYPYYEEGNQVYVLKAAIGENIILNGRIFNNNLSISPDTLQYIANIQQELSPAQLTNIINDLTQIKEITQSIQTSDLAVIQEKLNRINIEKLDAAIASLEVLTDKVAELENEKTTQAGQISNMTDELTVLQTRTQDVVDTTSLDDIFTAKLAAVSDEISSMSTSINSRLDNVDTSIVNLNETTSSIPELTTNVSALQTSFDTLSTDTQQNFDTINSNITELQIQYNGLTRQVETLDSQVSAILEDNNNDTE